MVQNSHESIRTGPLAHPFAPSLAPLTHSLPSSYESEWFDVSNRPGIVPECTRCWKALSALEEVEWKWFHYNKDQPGHRWYLSAPLSVGREKHASCERFIFYEENTHAYVYLAHTQSHAHTRIHTRAHTRERTQKRSCARTESERQRLARGRDSMDEGWHLAEWRDYFLSPLGFNHVSQISSNGTRIPFIFSFFHLFPFFHLFFFSCTFFLSCSFFLSISLFLGSSFIH